MTKINLILLFVVSMVFTIGQKIDGEKLYDESYIIADLKAKGYEVVEFSKDGTVEFSKDDAFEEYIKLTPYSVQVYFYTKKYAKKYNVPEEIAFSVAQLETNYLGPNMFKYKPNQTSIANAYGTYQLLLSTARYMYEGNIKDITPNILLKNVKINTRLGIKYIRHLYDKYNSWIIACGYYNTGYPKINQYARDAVKYLNTYDG